MTSLSFLAEGKSPLVADASVVINLNASGYAADIIRAFPASFVVTPHSLEELRRGSMRGHDDADALQRLVSQGVVSIGELGDAGMDIYAQLIDGSALVTLDDGEASTIGHAHEEEGVALIDEKKGRSLCATRYPALAVVSTVELLMHGNVEQALGKDAQKEALLGALRKARMRVPYDQVEAVVALIGMDAAKSCHSLPRRKDSRG